MIKTAIGLGPAVWGYSYATFFGARMDLLYVFAAILVVLLVVLFCLLVPTHPSAPTQKAGSNTQELVEQKSLWNVLLSLDALAICVPASTVCWGTAFVWTSKLSTFAVAYGHRE